MPEEVTIGSLIDETVGFMRDTANKTVFLRDRQYPVLIQTAVEVVVNRHANPTAAQEAANNHLPAPWEGPFADLEGWEIEGKVGVWHGTIFPGGSTPSQRLANFAWGEIAAAVEYVLETAEEYSDLRALDAARYVSRETVEVPRLRLAPSVPAAYPDPPRGWE